MFAEVVKNDLVVGVKYAILVPLEFFMYFTGTFNGRTFHNMKSHYYIENICMYNKITHIHGMDKDIRFYIFVSQKEKIQQAMEKRALNKILKRIINDDFTW